MEIHGAEQRSFYTSGRPHSGADGYLKEICGRFTLEQAHHRTSEPVGAVWAWRIVVHGWDPHWSSLWRTAAWKKDPHWRSSQGTVSCGSDTTLEQRKSVRSPPEGVAQTTCDELTRTPFPHPSVLLGEEEVEKGRWSWAWEGGSGFLISFFSSLSYSDLLGY